MGYSNGYDSGYADAVADMKRMKTEGSGASGGFTLDLPGFRISGGLPMYVLYLPDDKGVADRVIAANEGAVGIELDQEGSSDRLNDLPNEGVVILVLVSDLDALGRHVTWDNGEFSGTPQIVLWSMAFAPVTMSEISAA